MLEYETRNGFREKLRQRPARILTRSFFWPVVRGAEASVRVSTSDRCLICGSRAANGAATPMLGELAFGQRGDEPGGWLAARSFSNWLPVVFTAVRLPNSQRNLFLNAFRSGCLIGKPDATR